MTRMQNRDRATRLRAVPVAALLLALCALAVLAGCGNRAQDPVWLAVRASLAPDTPATSTSTGTSTGTARSTGGTLAEQQARVRAQVAASDYEGPLLMVSLPQRGAVATMAPVTPLARGGTEVWADAQGITITLRQGVVIATRGTGFDLMASDMSGRIAALGRSGPRDYLVRRRHLDAEGALRFSETVCTMREGTDGQVETCEETPQLANWYARQPQAASRQWLGAELGAVHLERLQ